MRRSNNCTYISTHIGLYSDTVIAIDSLYKLYSSTQIICSLPRAQSPIQYCLASTFTPSAICDTDNEASQVNFVKSSPCNELAAVDASILLTIPFAVEKRQIDLLAVH